MNQRHPLALLLLLILVVSPSHAAITDSSNSSNTHTTNTSLTATNNTGLTDIKPNDTSVTTTANSTNLNDTSVNGTTGRSLIEPDPNPNNTTDVNSGVDGGISGSQQPAANTPPVQDPLPNGTETQWPTSQGANNKNLSKHIAAVVGGSLAAAAVLTGAAVGVGYLVKHKRKQNGVGAMTQTPQNIVLKGKIEHMHREENNVDRDQRNIGQIHSPGSAMLPDPKKGAFWMGDRQGFDAFHDHMGNQPLKRPNIFKDYDKQRRFNKPFGRQFVERHKYGRQALNGEQALFESHSQENRRSVDAEGNYNRKITRLVENGKTFDQMQPRLMDSAIGYTGKFKTQPEKEKKKQLEARNAWELTQARNRERPRGTGRMDPNDMRGMEFERIEERSTYRYTESASRVSFRGPRGRRDSIYSLSSQATFSEAGSVHSTQTTPTPRRREPSRGYAFDYSQPRGGIGVRGVNGKTYMAPEGPSSRLGFNPFGKLTKPSMKLTKPTIGLSGPTIGLSGISGPSVKVSGPSAGLSGPSGKTLGYSPPSMKFSLPIGGLTGRTGRLRSEPPSAEGPSGRGRFGFRMKQRTPTFQPGRLSQGIFGGDFTPESPSKKRFPGFKSPFKSGTGVNSTLKGRWGGIGRKRQNHEDPIPPGPEDDNQEITTEGNQPSQKRRRIKFPKADPKNRFDFRNIHKRMKESRSNRRNQTAANGGDVHMEGEQNTNQQQRQAGQTNQRGKRGRGRLRSLFQRRSQRPAEGNANEEQNENEGVGRQTNAARGRVGSVAGGSVGNEGQGSVGNEGRSRVGSVAGSVAQGSVRNEGQGSVGNEGQGSVRNAAGESVGNEEHFETASEGSFEARGRRGSVFSVDSVQLAQFQARNKGGWV